MYLVLKTQERPFQSYRHERDKVSYLNHSSLLEHTVQYLVRNRPRQFFQVISVKTPIDALPHDWIMFLRQNILIAVILIKSRHFILSWHATKQSVYIRKQEKRKASWQEDHFLILLVKTIINFRANFWPKKIATSCISWKYRQLLKDILLFASSQL